MGSKAHVFSRVLVSHREFAQILATCGKRLACSIELGADLQTAHFQPASRSQVAVRYQKATRRTVDGAGSSYALQIGDLNRDGKMDIIVGYVGAIPTIYFNDRLWSAFHAAAFRRRQTHGLRFSVADLDEDGLPDIVVARSDAESMLYFGGPINQWRPPTRGRLTG